MKAITLHQPWASLIVDGYKQYETRSWNTSYRGLIAIHAGKTNDGESARYLQKNYDLPDYTAAPLGAVLGIGRLVACHKTEDVRDNLSSLEHAVGNYGDNRYAWEIQLLERFPTPIEAKGQQGLWAWDLPDKSARVAVVGSRAYSDLERVRRWVQNCSDIIVVSGGASGVDTAAVEAAQAIGLQTAVYPAPWSQYGASAGMMRNKEMLSTVGSVVAFWDGSSPGTKHAIEYAQSINLPVTINPEPPAEDIPEGRVAREIALPVAQELARLLEPACEQLYVAGSLRRGKPHVGDIELVAVPRFYDGENALWWVLDRLEEKGTIRRGKSWNGTKQRKFYYQDIKIDLFTALPHALGLQYQLRTGSGDFNKRLMMAIKNAPFSVSGGEVIYDGKTLDIPTEGIWFELLGLPFIPPHQRTTNVLKKHLAHHTWGDPKQYIHQPKQLKLVGFNVYDELSVIESAHLKAESSPEIESFEWEAPWLVEETDAVWVYDGWEDGQRTYILADRNHPRVEKQARLIRHFYLSETQQLQDWLERERWLPVPLPVADIGALHVSYALRSGAKMEYVSIDDVVLTQETYNRGIWRNYYRSGKTLDTDGQPMFGIRFSGENRVFLLDGTHRFLAQWAGGRDKIHINICSYNETFAEACQPDESDDDIHFLADVMAEVVSILNGEVEYA